MNSNQTKSGEENIKARSQDEQPDRQELLEEWKIAVKSSMHFNDILFKMRLLGLSIFFTILGIGLTILSTQSSDINNIVLSAWTLTFLGDKPLEILLITFALVYLLGLFLFDFEYYYQALIGSVMRTMDIEKSLGIKQATVVTKTIHPFIATICIFFLYGSMLFSGLILMLILGSFTPFKIYFSIGLIFVLSFIDGVRRYKRTTSETLELPKEFLQSHKYGDIGYILLVSITSIIIGFYGLNGINKSTNFPEMQQAWEIACLAALGFGLVAAVSTFLKIKFVLRKT